MASDDIFAQVSQITACGPSPDDVQHVTEIARENQQVANIATSSNGGAAAASANGAQFAVGATVPTDTSFLNDAEIEKYEHDINEITVRSPLFSTMVPTTFGLNGVLTGVSFNECNIIPFIIPHLRFPCIRAVCNFGDVKTPDFDRLVSEGRIDLSATVKAARARAKKSQRTGVTPRKTQGNGTCFNSSVLFWIYSESHKTVYKIRLFRTGGLGFPGTKPEMIRDMLRIIRDIFIPMLRDILIDQNRATSTAQSPPEQPPLTITLQSLVSIMKNYKWIRLLEPGCMLDLHAIRNRIQSDAREVDKIPYALGYAYYGYSDSKLSAKFRTPTEKRPDKMVRINIFLSGKINILGAHNSTVTKNICQYLVTLLSDPSFIIQPVIDDEDPNGSFTIAATNAIIKDNAINNKASIDSLSSDEDTDADEDEDADADADAGAGAV